MATDFIVYVDIIDIDNHRSGRCHTHLIMFAITYCFVILHGKIRSIDDEYHDKE